MCAPLRAPLITCVSPPKRLQVELAKRNGHRVVPGGDGDVYYVQNSRKPDQARSEVILSAPACCAYVIQHRQPCRHMAAVFFATGLMSTSRRARATLAKYWPKCFLADMYADTYRRRAIRLPGIYPGAFVGNDADRLGPPAMTRKKPGRPPTKRRRRRRNTAAAIAESLPQVLCPEYDGLIRFA